MASYAYKECPVLLLSYSETSREFTLSEDGRQFLRSLSSPIGVAGVAGMYRTGKSYLLNRVLLDRKGGFGVGPTVNPCTKGIWIWGTPIKGHLNNGTPCSVIILDTEGIGALDQDSDHDSRIFSLTVLIVSCFIYNSVGSIDEEALSNLSLVVNLTKHIQIKSKNNEEVGTEEYAQYFPTFIWVVRDFALRLVDNDGEALTSKEYLEKALNAQKGFSDLAEEKNRIRRLLKEFFKDRDCCTLVRPVSNEKDLHSLEEVEFRDLRPEFVEQVNVLRGKVLNGIKPKTLNGRNLNGDMLLELIESYVQAVNKGAVPNIENAWNYICKNECSKALEEAQEIYNKTLEQSLENNFPNFESEIFDFHKEAQKKSFTFFRSKALGEEMERVYLKLKDIVHEKFEQLKFQNEVESEKQCIEFLKNNYAKLNSKLKGGEYPSFLEFEREMRTLQQYFKEHGPRGPHREKLLLQFCQGKLIEAADIFMKHLYSEIEIIESTNAEKIKILESDNTIFKEEVVKEKVELSKKVVIIENEKKELIAKDTAMQEQLEILQAQKDKMENELKASLKKAKDDFSKELEISNKKAAEFEGKAKSIERTSGQQISELNEQSALLLQKISYLEASLEETKKKEKELDAENKSLVKSQMAALKDAQAKYESSLRAAENKIQEEIDLKSSLEKELDEVGRILQEKQSELETNTSKFHARLEESSQQLKTLTQNFDSKEKDLTMRLKETERSYEEIITKLNKRIEEIERRAKKTEDALKADMNRFEKDNAIMVQKIEFLETQLADCKHQLDEERKQHSMMLISLSSIADNSKNLELELEQLKEKHINEVKYIDAQNEASKKDLIAEIEKLTQMKTDSELRYKLDSAEWLQKQELFNEELLLVTQEKDRLKDQITEIKRNFDQLIADNESKYKAKITYLEKQIDENTERFTTELDKTTRDAEVSYNKLKEFYEGEKKRLDSRISEEKERADKKYKAVVEEYEERLRRESESFEEEIAVKEQDLRELESFMNQELNSLRNQASLDAQKISSLEGYLKDQKDQLEAHEKSYNSLVEQIQTRFSAEREALQDKIDKLIAELSAKDRELSILNYKKQQTDQQIEQRSEELKELRQTHESNKKELMRKVEDLKIANKALTDENISLKSDSKRENALLQQEVEFKNSRLAEFERNLKDTEEKYRETLRMLKSEGGQDSSAVESLSNSKALIEKKLMEKKKTMKQLREGFMKQASQIETEKAVLNEKVLNLERNLAECEFKFNLERDKLLEKLNERKEIESQQTVLDEIDRLKQIIEELEQELSNKSSLLEKEKILWENKFSFLVQQKDSAKADLYEAQHKFEFTLQQLQKREQSGKERQEGAMSSLVSSIESRYTSQIKELQDSHTASIEHLTLKLKLLDQENKGLKEELEISRRSKSLISGTIEKRCRQLQEIETKLNAEIDGLRIEKERKHREVFELESNENESMRGKLMDMERKVKEAETQRHSMFLELEKERSKWQMERDHLLSAKNEALEAAEKVQSKSESLVRENERLRGDKLKARMLQSKRMEHHKTHSSQLVSSPTKLPEFYSQRAEEDLSAKSEFITSQSRRRSFAE